jgi:hypothetical protein
MLNLNDMAGDGISNGTCDGISIKRDALRALRVVDGAARR